MTEAVDRIGALLRSSGPLEATLPGELSEIIRCELTKVAMERRHQELRRSSIPESGAERGGREAASAPARFVLDGESWLAAFRVPARLIMPGSSLAFDRPRAIAFSTAERGRCVFSRKRDFRFLEGYRSPRSCPGEAACAGSAREPHPAGRVSGQGPVLGSGGASSITAWNIRR